MSFSDIRPYVKARMLTVDPEFSEWTDAFNVENVPNTIIEKAWHLMFDPASAVSLNQTGLLYDCPITIRVHFKGYREPQDAVDLGVQNAEAIIREFVKHVNRLTQTSIKNVTSTGWNLEPLAASNDNIVVLVLSFNLEILLDIN